ncbi:MAG: hypothetical protein J7501_06270 [Bdellovibrio sp.]|nr:hypothetical protein [Bdellovibrio sp.]
MRAAAITGIVGTVVAVILICIVGFTKKPGERCIGIFYDNKDVISSVAKALHSYPDFEKVYTRIENYSSGEIERCQASFIINTEFENKIPRRLLEDYTHSERNVAWLGYNIWQLGEHLEKNMGLRYIGAVSKAHEGSCDLFYRGRVSACSERGLPLQLEFLPTNHVRIEIMAESRVRGGRELTPYLVRSRNRFYMADVNFGSVFADFLSELVGSPLRLKAEPSPSRRLVKGF